jgi:carotenoid cleavage dioxygenase
VAESEGSRQVGMLSSRITDLADIGSVAPMVGLLGTVLDSARDRTGLAVLDAQHIADGPIAMAWLQRSFPLGFHGHFASS